jgi:hypothetical protein
MARKAAVKGGPAATPREVRAFLLENQDSLPEGVTVGARGRLSAAAKQHFTDSTGREIVANDSAAPVAAE